jgi:hypothetical protein
VEREVYQEVKRIWQKAIRDAKRKFWESFLEHAHMTDVWMAVRYTKTGRIAGVLTLIDAEGDHAEDAVSKMQFLAEWPSQLLSLSKGVEGSMGRQVRHGERSMPMGYDRLSSSCQEGRRQAPMVSDHRQFVCYRNGMRPGLLH